MDVITAAVARRLFGSGVDTLKLPPTHPVTEARDYSARREEARRFLQSRNILEVKSLYPRIKGENS